MRLGTVFEGQVGDDPLERRSLPSKILELVRSRGTSRVTGQAFLASLHKVFRPAIVQVLRDLLAAAQFGDARTMQIFSSAEYCLRLALRMSLTTFSAVSFAKLECCLIFAPLNATMSQKYSLLQSAQSVTRTPRPSAKTAVAACGYSNRSAAIGFIRAALRAG